MNRIAVAAAAVTFAQLLPQQAVASPATEDALSADRATARAAIVELRSQGSRGLEALLAAHAGEVEAITRELEQGHSLSPELQRLREAVESVAKQRDAHASGLYWHTDLASALKEARRTGKPVLSLRLLGQLDEELSCANSRFFRVALYANSAISDELRSGWVLHWETVRPAPRLTIDYGDGRVVERTITGNSLHLALAADGSVLDVLPGLYGPGPFLSWIEDVGELAARSAALPAPARRAMLRRHHVDAEQRLAVGERWPSPGDGSGDPRLAPTALKALPLALTKMVAEAPLVRQIDPAAPEPPPAFLDDAARTRSVDGRLDAASLRVLRSKLGRLEDEARARAVFEDRMVRDGIANEIRFHGPIHGWLAEGGALDAGQLVARIYDDLFLTPSTDPWLGLVSPELFAAIEGDGRRR